MRAGHAAWPVYLRLQFRRILRLLPGVLAVSAVFLAAVVLLGHSFFLSDSGSASKKIVRIGVVGDADDPLLSLAVSTLRTLDTSRLSTELVEMSRAEAASELRKGALQAYVVIPEGFFESVDQYRNDVPITYVSTDGAVGIGTVMVNEIAETVGALLLESENAVYGMQSFAFDRFSDQLSPQEISALGYGMTERYALTIFRREAMYDVRETGLMDALTFRGYYVCAFVLLFLLLLAVPFSPLHTDRDLSLFRLLRLRGISCFGQVSAEYLAFAATVYLILTVSLPAAGALIGAGGFSVPEFTPGSAVRGMLSLLPAALPAVLAVCGLQFFLFELFTGAVSGILMQVAAALSAAYLSGCFYPVSYFPENMRAAADFLPAGSARLLLEGQMLGRPDGAALARTLLWAALFLVLSALARRLRRR